MNCWILSHILMTCLFNDGLFAHACRQDKYNIYIVTFCCRINTLVGQAWPSLTLVRLTLLSTFLCCRACIDRSRVSFPESPEGARPSESMHVRWSQRRQDSNKSEWYTVCPPLCFEYSTLLYLPALHQRFYTMFAYAPNYTYSVWSASLTLYSTIKTPKRSRNHVLKYST